MLAVGQSAPFISRLNSEGTAISLSEFRNKKNIVLYFYPKDATPGCTIEAQDFNNRLSEFRSLDCVIFGISKDSASSHCKFIENQGLEFELLSDTNGELCELYNVIKEKSMFGKKYFGIERSTFLINKAGKIAKIWRSVKVNGHADEVLHELKNL